MWSRALGLRCFTALASAAPLLLACEQREQLRPLPPRPWLLPPPPREPFRLSSCLSQSEPLSWCQPDAKDLPPREARAELLRSAALNVLGYRCAECHTSLSREPVEPASIDDVATLVRSRLVVPLHSGDSPLFRLAAAGEQRRTVSGELLTVPGHEALSAGELDLLTLWLDTPSFWPGAAPTCESTSSAPSFDELLASVAADLAAVPEDDRAFQRYLSLAHRASAECAPAELELERQALSKGINLLSSNGSVLAPLALDAARTLYRIDLRQLGWARELTLGDATFADVWEAIAASSPYSLQLTGPAAESASAAAHTPFPLLLADHALDVALSAELYYRILGLESGATLSEVIAELGIDEFLELEEGRAPRAATGDSRVTEDDRIVQRYEQGVRPGALWQVLDQSGGGSESIFEDPLELGRAASQAMFTLPNGLFAFLSADANDALSTSSGMKLDLFGYELPAHDAVTCSACHVAGLLPIVDQVKEVVRRNAREIGLDEDEVADIERAYPDPDVFLALLDDDSADYRTALSALGLPSSGRDPVAAASLRFGAPLTLRDAAAELGVSSEALLQLLPELPWLAPLSGGTLSRDRFARTYVASRCVLSASATLVPDAVACELAGE